MAGEKLDAALQATLPSVAQAVADGDLPAAARAFGELVATDDELSRLVDSGYLRATAPFMPVFLRELGQADQPGARSPTDAAFLEAIDVPLLLLRGRQSALHDWMVDATHHVADHVADAHTQEIEGVGHFAVVFEPEAVATHLTPFFAATSTDEKALS